jgi:glycosyltransferase involved in cell wall biosynthesis
MRILHIVTLVSPDSAYGGPVRVAANQCSSLRDRGHDITIAAATRGFDSPPNSLNENYLQPFPARTTIPKIGFAGLRGAGMSRWLRSQLRDIDVAHIHLARDFVTLPAARLIAQSNTPFVLQTHGMIDPTNRLLAKPLDLFWTRPVLNAASTVFYLTPREANDLNTVAGTRVNLRELNNGVPSAAAALPPPAQDGRPEVLFLARLHPRKRPGMFVQMAQHLLRDDIDADFTLAGPDEGAKRDVDRLLADGPPDSRIRYDGVIASDAVSARLARASVYVLPSIDEPYPMSVLEAMAVGLPVVVTDTCGLAPLISRTRSGLVAGPDLDSLTEAIRCLLRTPKLLQEMGCNARRTAVETLGMSSVTDILEESYRRAILGN